MPKGIGKGKTSAVKFHAKGKWNKGASTDGQSSKNPKIPDGLIMITGFTEEGVDESKSNDNNGWLVLWFQQCQE